MLLFFFHGARFDSAYVQSIVPQILFITALKGRLYSYFRDQEDEYQRGKATEV